MKTDIQSIVDGIVNDKPSQVVVYTKRILDSHIDQVSTLVTEGVKREFVASASKDKVLPKHLIAVLADPTKTVTESSNLSANPLSFLYVNDKAIADKHLADLKEIAYKNPLK